MKADFTEEEKKTLNGKVRSLARKHAVSHTYINSIINNEIEITTSKASKIFDDLKNTIAFFTPISE